MNSDHGRSVREAEEACWVSMWVRRQRPTLVVIGCDRVNRCKSGGYGSHADAECGYCARLGKLEVKGSVIVEMGAGMGDKVEGTITTAVGRRDTGGGLESKSWKCFITLQQCSCHIA